MGIVSLNTILRKAMLATFVCPWNWTVFRAEVEIGVEGRGRAPSPQPSPASGRGGCPACSGSSAPTCRSGPCPRFRAQGALLHAVRESADLIRESRRSFRPSRTRSAPAIRVGTASRRSELAREHTSLRCSFTSKNQASPRPYEEAICLPPPSLADSPHSMVGDGCVDGVGAASADADGADAIGICGGLGQPLHPPRPLSYICLAPLPVPWILSMFSPGGGP